MPWVTVTKWAFPNIIIGFCLELNQTVACAMAPIGWDLFQAVGAREMPSVQYVYSRAAACL